MKRGEMRADLVIERNIVEFASDAMREIVDAKGSCCRSTGNCCRSGRASRSRPISDAPNRHIRLS
jgi:hypothetical protein